MEDRESPRHVRLTPTRRALLSAGAATAVAATTAPLIAIPAYANEGPGGPYKAQPPDRELRGLLPLLVNVAMLLTSDG